MEAKSTHKTTVYQCPACSEVNSLRRSKARLWERPVGLFGLHPFRCRSCSIRFHRRWNISARTLAQLAIDDPPPIRIASPPLPPIPSYPSMKIEPLRAPKAAAKKAKLSLPRLQISPAMQYAFTSFAALLLLHFFVCAAEFAPLGKTAMWVNVLSLVTLVGALLAYIDLCRANRLSSEAVGATIALVLWWAGLFLAAEFVYGFVLGPGGHSGFRADVALYRDNAPFIWMTYVALLVSGVLGCTAYLLYRPGAGQGSRK